HSSRPSFPTRRSSDLPGGSGITVLPGRLRNARPPPPRWRLTALANAPVAPHTRLVEGSATLDVTATALQRHVARIGGTPPRVLRSEEHTSELQSPDHL